MIGRDDLTGGRVGERRRLAQEARHEAHLEHSEPEARAGLTCEEAHDLFQPALENVGGLQEHALPLGGDGLRPLGKGGGRSGHRLRGVGTRSRRNDERRSRR